MLHEQFRQALEDGDVKLVRKLAAYVMPHIPQPQSDGEAEAMMHGARTTSETVSFKKRAWSHRWLTERGLPSNLPDHLKPMAERMYSRVVEGVGISVNCKNHYFKPAMLEVRRSMENVVSDMYANGDTEPTLVKRRMLEARDRTLNGLFGQQTLTGVSS